MNEHLRLLVFFGLVGFLLWRNLPGALLFVRPGFIRCRPVGGKEHVSARSPAMREMVRDIEDLGFEPVGVVAQHRPLARAQQELVFASREDRSFAVVSPVRNEAWLQFVTPFQGGTTVITADYRMPSVDEKDYLAGGLPNGSPSEILLTHKRRVQRFVDEGKAVDDRWTVEARAETCGAFYARGPGRKEIRRQEVKQMMFATVALVWVGMMVVGALKR